MDALKQRLIDEKGRLQTATQTRVEDLNLDQNEQASVDELSSIDQHQADLATDTFEREKEMAILRTMQDQMSEIEAALDRIDAGTYGKCEECGSDIGDERLDAIPTARFCIDHAGD
ncbi:MAG TPA: TraR/DksA C4-type zinc finger protein [Actinomycetota bacterium]|nr:TraR/DksA C4-type zinc finger protein [Actinomycetota bacterium]